MEESEAAKERQKMLQKAKLGGYVDIDESAEGVQHGLDLNAGIERVVHNAVADARAMNLLLKTRLVELDHDPFVGAKEFKAGASGAMEGKKEKPVTKQEFLDYLARMRVDQGYLHKSDAPALVVGPPGGKIDVLEPNAAPDAGNFVLPKETIVALAVQEATDDETFKDFDPFVRDMLKIVPAQVRDLLLKVPDVNELSTRNFIVPAKRRDWRRKYLCTWRDFDFRAHHNRLSGLFSVRWKNTPESNILAHILELRLAVAENTVGHPFAGLTCEECLKPPDPGYYQVSSRMHALKVATDSFIEDE